MVRKYRATKGALRHNECAHGHAFHIARQKAQSAKMCIKTLTTTVRQNNIVTGQKAPSAKRCIKTLSSTGLSTKVVCHKAPSAKRCIKTQMNIGIFGVSFGSSESTERQTVH